MEHKYFKIFFSEEKYGDIFDNIYCSSLSFDNLGSRVASESKKACKVTPPCSSALNIIKKRTKIISMLHIE